jgi:hypothetical protein
VLEVFSCSGNGIKKKGTVGRLQGPLCWIWKSLNLAATPGCHYPLSLHDHLSSDQVQKIRVRTKPNAYVVQVGAGLLRRAGREVRRVLPSSGSRVFVITSPNVRRHWGEALEKSLRDARLPYEVLEMHDGEPAKRLHTVEQLAESLVDAKADRKSLLVAFGGGVVGDSAGFLAAVFMRGIPVVQIPTTVVAQDRSEFARREKPDWLFPSAQRRLSRSGYSGDAR